MKFFEKLFKRKKIEKQPQKEKLNLEFSDIKEEGGQIYFTISGEIDKIPSEIIDSTVNKFTQNLEIPTLIRQNFKVETGKEGTLKIVFNTENYQNIEGFIEETRRLLNEIKTDLETKLS